MEQILNRQSIIIKKIQRIHTNSPHIQTVNKSIEKAAEQNSWVYRQAYCNISVETVRYFLHESKTK